jgi:hypothetical protein
MLDLACGRKDRNLLDWRLEESASSSEYNWSENPLPGGLCLSSPAQSAEEHAPSQTTISDPNSAHSIVILGGMGDLPLNEPRGRLSQDYV